MSRGSDPGALLHRGLELSVARQRPLRNRSAWKEGKNYGPANSQLLVVKATNGRCRHRAARRSFARLGNIFRVHGARDVDIRIIARTAIVRLSAMRSAPARFPQIRQTSARSAADCGVRHRERKRKKKRARARVRTEKSCGRGIFAAFSRNVPFFAGIRFSHGES